MTHLSRPVFVVLLLDGCLNKSRSREKMTQRCVARACLARASTIRSGCVLTGITRLNLEGSYSKAVLRALSRDHGLPLPSTLTSVAGSTGPPLLLQDPTRQRVVLASPVTAGNKHLPLLLPALSRFHAALSRFHTALEGMEKHRGSGH